jgi:hypothetical protein
VARELATKGRQQGEGGRNAVCCGILQGMTLLDFRITSLPGSCRKAVEIAGGQPKDKTPYPRPRVPTRASKSPPHCPATSTAMGHASQSASRSLGPGKEMPHCRRSGWPLDEEKRQPYSWIRRQIRRASKASARTRRASGVLHKDRHGSSTGMPGLSWVIVCFVSH